MILNQLILVFYILSILREYIRILMLNYSMISVFLSLVTIPFAVWPNQLNFGLIIRISNPKPILSHETYLLGETYIKKLIIFLTLKKDSEKLFFGVSENVQ